MLFSRKNEIVITNANEARDYIKKHGIEKFKTNMKKSQQNFFSRYFLTIILLFPVYLLLCSTIYIGNPINNNEAVYNLLRAIHFPVRTPLGWNLSYFLAFIFAIIQYAYFYFTYPYVWLKKDFKYKKIRLAINLWFLALLMVPAYYVSSVHTVSDNCTVYDLCFLDFGDFFFTCSLTGYGAINHAFLFFFAGLKPIVSKDFKGDFL